jgi:putative phage-type endonuclease
MNQMERYGIGASDAAVALNLSKYKTGFALWEEKCGLREPEDLSNVEAVEMGILLEPIVAELFERRNPGKRLFNVNAIQVHPEHKFITCNLDRRVVGEKACAEIKTAGQWAAASDEWGEPGTDEVPLQYRIQVQHQLAVTGYERGYIPVLIGGQKYAQYVIERDDKLIASIIEGERAFWQCVLDKTPPPVHSVEEAVERFPVSAAVTVQATDDVKRHLEQFARYKLASEEALKMSKDFKTMVLALMGNADTLVDGDRILATWKSAKASESFDEAQLEKDHPDLYASYMRTVPGSRRFLPKTK